MCLSQAPTPVKEPPFVVKEFEKTIGWVRSVKISRDGRRFATVSSLVRWGPNSQPMSPSGILETGEEIKKETGVDDRRHILLDDLRTSLDSESQFVIREIESGTTNHIRCGVAREHYFWCSTQSQDGKLLAVYLTEFPSIGKKSQNITLRSRSQESDPRIRKKGRS